MALHENFDDPRMRPKSSGDSVLPVQSVDARLAKLEVAVFPPASLPAPATENLPQPPAPTPIEAEPEPKSEPEPEPEREPEPVAQTKTKAHSRK